MDLQLSDAVTYHEIAILPAKSWMVVTKGVRKLCTSSDRACLIANIEYGPEGCVHVPMSRANDIITGEIED